MAGQEGCKERSDKNHLTASAVSIKLPVMINHAILKELEGGVGQNNLLTSRADLVCYSYDATGQSFMPDAVVLPANTGEVSEIVRLANKYRLPLIPRGAGSGFT